MSTNYSPGGAYPTFPLSLPEDGEIINEAVLVTGILQPIIDGIGVNAARTWTATQSFDSIVVTAGNNYDVSSRSETRIIPLVWVSISGFVCFPVNSADAGVGGQCGAVIRLPHGCTLTAISLYVDPAAHAAVPAVFPSFTLSYRDAATNTPTLVTTGTDSGLLAAYVVYHEIPKTGLSVAIDSSANTYYVTFTGESGANSEVGLNVFAQCKVVYTRTTIGED